MAAYHKKWKGERRDSLARRRRELYALQTADAKRERERRWWERAPYRKRARILYEGARSRAAELGIPHDREALGRAAIEAWLRKTPACECCARVFELIPTFGVKSDASPSIDRIVPSLGYVPGNVALLCWRCNNLKRDATAAELRRVADWLASRT